MIKTQERARAIADQAGITDKVVLLGYRSATSMYGQYDDIIALLTPDTYLEYKGNTLPSIWRKGIAQLVPGEYKYRQGLHGIHHLSPSPADQQILKDLEANPGKDYPVPVYETVAGKKVQRILPYWAFRQAGPVTVKRGGSDNLETEKNPALWPWIDIHHGGFNLTSSEGCQTLYPDHWADFRAKGFAAMDQYGQKEIIYCLIQE